MRRLVLVMVIAAGALAACGDGEDRPGTVVEEDGGGTGTGSASGTATGSASGTHTGSASGTGTGSASGTGTGSATAAAPAFEESDADTVVQVTLKDFAFEGLPRTIKGPKVFFKANNAGPEDHELEILDANGEALGEIEAMPVGRSGTLALELEPGTYTAQCLVETDGKPHTDLGMTATFTVE
jgi:plastocyanin